ncbi:unnamed protein product [Ilex paraguariensis]|uniref:Transcription elongation factor n=1 Tax=Ilex paraguariensis TaxID=185542 RepID=A0ABC8R1A9_9AQUA
MANELIELFEAVKKAADAAAVDGGAESSPEEDRCLDALKQLKKFPVNYQVLVSTQVGKRLRHVTKHPRKKIQALASELMDIWKNIVLKETTKKNGSVDNKDSVKTEPAGAESSKVKKLQKVNSMRAEASSKVQSVKVENIDRSGALHSEKRIKAEYFSATTKAENLDVVKFEKSTAGESIKVEKITKEEKQTSNVRKPASSPIAPPKLSSGISCKDPLRDKIRELLSEALCRVAGEVDEDQRDEVNACDPFRVAVLVESAMFEKWGRSNGVQKSKYRSIMFNMKDNKNPDFRRKVLLGQFKPDSVPGLTPEDMASDQRQQQIEKIKEKALFDCERGGQAKATTDAFKCGRCGKKETTYYQLQTRSADEPMTTFVTCVNCNNHWKFC